MEWVSLAVLFFFLMPSLPFFVPDILILWCFGIAECYIIVQGCTTVTEWIFIVWSCLAFCLSPHPLRSLAARGIWIASTLRMGQRHSSKG